MTRIGAHDRLVKGESTFMVEMKETSNILRLATSKSLILLDEVGRGTSTFDGISIAYAVLEYIHKKIGAKVLFATHFFEITELAEKYPGIKNFNISVKEWVNSRGKTEISFLHKVVEGSADKSYGVHVAQIAGIPEECVKRAKEILNELETRNIDIKSSSDMLPIFSSNPIIDKIRMIDVNNLTPIEALNILNELKKEV
jgi:DNA mismatch repair protein MutS